MRPVTVAIARVHGMGSQLGWERPEFPGLAVYEFALDHWPITHQLTGRLIATCHSLHAAYDAIGDLGRCEFDWTATDRDEMQAAAKGNDQLREVIRRLDTEWAWRRHMDEPTGDEQS